MVFLEGQTIDIQHLKGIDGIGALRLEGYLNKMIEAVLFIKRSCALILLNDKTIFDEEGTKILDLGGNYSFRDIPSLIVPSMKDRDKGSSITIVNSSDAVAN